MTHSTDEDAIDIAVIGGGVIGCAIAWALSSRGIVFLFEKNRGITQGENQSSRNSGVIHSGIYYDQKTRPQKAALCVEGNARLYAFCERHGVPALKTGKLVVATSPQEEEVLNLYLARARENGVPGVQLISGREVAAREPNVAATSALEVPTAGIVDPASLVYTLHALAARKGVHFMTQTEVTDLEGGPDAIRLTFRYKDGATETVKAATVINAGGVYADQVARLLDPGCPYEVDPVRGESYKFYSHKRAELNLKGWNVYPTPVSVETPHGRHFTVGVHLTPTFEDLSSPPGIGSTVTVGPKVIPVTARDDLTDNRIGPHVFASAVQRFFPGLKTEDLLWHQAGIQARLKGEPDFVIQRDRAWPRCIHLLGIDSPGLTASLAIAQKVAGMVEELMD